MPQRFAMGHCIIELLVRDRDRLLPYIPMVRKIIIVLWRHNGGVLTAGSVLQED